MSGYVNSDGGGWTELRVHGVAGTPPEDMLGHPHVVRVAGDADAGFYRRWWEAEPVAADTAEQRLEAYSWGGLTAGSGQRALWLLLTPFLLVNVAFWAQPPAGDGRGRRTARRVGDTAQRLFALTLTLALVASVALVSMDFAGWQCGRPAHACAEKVSWLEFLSWSWLDLPGRRLAVTAAAPLAVVALLWWLAQKTWRGLEATDVPSTVPEDRHRTPLEDRRMWNGGAPVRRLRAVHVAAGFALVGVLLLAPFLEFGGPVVGVLMVVTLGLLAWCVVLTCLARMTERSRPDGEDHDVGRRDGYTVLPWLALGLAALAAVVVAQPAIGAARPGDARPALPGLAPTVHALTGAQVALLLAVIVVLPVRRAPRRSASADPDAGAAAHPDAGPGRAADADSAPAWGGLVTAGLMLTGASLGTTFGAGLAVSVAHVLGRPAPAALGPDTYVVPMPYFWAAALTVPVAAGSLLLAGLGQWLIRRDTARTLRDRVVPAYPAAGICAALAAPDAPGHAATLRRARRIAAEWSGATVSDVVERLAGALVALLAVLVAAGVLGYLADPEWVYTHARWAVNIGDALVGGLVAGLLYVGRQAYGHLRFRRTVGVLWDVGTFWPRATHPLAPPCYAERAVPDLIRRIHHLGHACAGRVLLSCHSQGTVIGAAVVMQLTYAESARVALLTHGAPLRRIYGRFFPGYFGTMALRRTGALLVGPPLDTSDGARARWPWRNLYRPSDPIGGWVLRDRPAVEISPAEWAADPRAGDNGDVDRCVIDPVFARAAGDSAYPPTRGHSAYPDEPAYGASVDIVRELRVATPRDR
ncbi:hypothetical protein SAMN05444365_102138 [Micromonospora pattaloongensis]|uniref:Integral membrane protein n=1 Tax=Micromonospora pattaloongensis TaxID=405436 RepID=A0A1H3JJS7_9ACTN|nr:hypothetical protein [Micromonospora pattaloongensis]SDY39839.1 hypothetical protein SAMN05444365_102138 [Micromonospora pattaloongensis]